MEDTKIDLSGESWRIESREEYCERHRSHFLGSDFVPQHLPPDTQHHLLLTITNVPVTLTGRFYLFPDTRIGVYWPPLRRLVSFCTCPPSSSRSRWKRASGTNST